MANRKLKALLSSLDVLQTMTEEEARSITALQMPSFNENHIAVLTPDQLNALRREAVGALSEQQVSWIDRDKIRRLNDEFFKNLSRQGIAGLTPEGMAVLSADQLNVLSREAVRALSGQQVSRIDLDQIQQLNREFFRDLSGDGIAGLTLQGMAVLSADQLNVLSREAVGALSRQQVSRIGLNQIERLNGEFFKKLPREGIAGLTLKGMGVLSAGQLNGIWANFFSPEQVSAIIPQTFHELDGFFFSQLTQAQAAKLTKDQIDVMSIDQLNGLLQLSAVAGLTSVQVGAIKPETIAGLRVAFFHQLSPAAVAGFTTEHMAHFTDDMIRDLDAKFFNNLSAAAVDALCRPRRDDIEHPVEYLLRNKIPNLSAHFLNNLRIFVTKRLLSEDQFKKIPPVVIPSLESKIFKDNPVIGENGFLACTIAQASCLTADQVGALGSRVFSLDPQALGALTSHAVSGLSARHVVELAADKAAKVDAFSLEVIAHLPAPFLSALRAIDAKQFKAAQARRFTAKQLEALSGEAKQVLQQYIQGGVAGGGAAAAEPIKSDRPPAEQSPPTGNAKAQASPAGGGGGGAIAAARPIKGGMPPAKQSPPAVNAKTQASPAPGSTANSSVAGVAPVIFWPAPPRSSSRNNKVLSDQDKGSIEKKVSTAIGALEEYGSKPDVLPIAKEAREGKKSFWVDEDARIINQHINRLFARKLAERLLSTLKEDGWQAASKQLSFKQLNLLYLQAVLDIKRQYSKEFSDFFTLRSYKGSAILKETIAGLQATFAAVQLPEQAQPETFETKLARLQEDLKAYHQRAQALLLLNSQDFSFFHDRRHANRKLNVQTVTAVLERLKEAKDDAAVLSILNQIESIRDSLHKKAVATDTSLPGAFWGINSAELKGIIRTAKAEFCSDMGAAAPAP